jgi:O-antigen ligase
MSLYAFKPDLIPTYNHYLHVQSYVHRLYIWHETAALIFENSASHNTFWRGIGMDGTRYHPKAHTSCHFPYVNPEGGISEIISRCIPLHPHNAILQLWLELGLPGCILSILLVYQILNAIFQTTLSVREKAIGAGLFTAAFLVVWVNLGFWQTWWIAGLWIIIGMTICLFKGKEDANELY